jgi:hypothetical protein
MKSRSMSVALLLAFVLTTPLVTFAGGQPAKVRNYGTPRANAWRSQTAQQSPIRSENSSAAHPNWGDPAFHK